MKVLYNTFGGMSRGMFEINMEHAAMQGVNLCGGNAVDLSATIK
jgi:hypothetical protein